MTDQLVATKPKRTPKQIAWRLTKSALFIYLCVCLGISMLQTKLIFPGSSTQGQKSSIHNPGKHEELLELKTPEGERVAALFALAKDADPKSRPTIIYFYGNGMCLADCIGSFRWFQDHGFNIIMPDYLGYGMSGGRPGEQGVYAAAEACWDYLEKSDRVDKSKIAPVGWSLGAAAAINIASKKKPAAVVTISAFTSMHAMGRSVFPYLPTGLIIKHHFRSEEKLKQIHVPLLIIHGDRDSIIPPIMASQLEKAAVSPVTRIMVPGGDHNDVFEVGGEELFQRIATFINDSVK